MFKIGKFCGRLEEVYTSRSYDCFSSDQGSNYCDHFIFCTKKVALFISILFTMEDMAFCEFDFDVNQAENFSSNKDDTTEISVYSHPKSFLKNLRLPSSIVC